MLINALLFAFALLIVSGFSPVPCSALQVTLGWDGNDDPDIRGHRVYSRQENQAYDYEFYSCDVSGSTCTIDGLDNQTAYYFVVRAYTDTDESANSNEVFYSPPSNTANQPPVADAGPDQNVNESTTVKLSGSNSIDPDDGIDSFYWQQIGGPAIELLNPNEEEASFQAPDAAAGGVTLSFRLSVADYGGLKSAATCIVNVSSINLPPSAEAGPDLNVLEGDLITLDASRSVDPDDGIGSFRWTQISGLPVTLYDANTHKATFTAPDINTAGESLKFQLTVTDIGGLKSSDTCFVTVSWVNDPPLAQAGADQTVTGGDSVTLDGCGSMDNDDGIVRYRWNQTAGTPVSLSDPAACETELTVPDAGPEDTLLTFKLTVTDKGELHAQDSCVVRVIPVSEADLNDNVTILKARYSSYRRKIKVKAVTDAPAGSVDLIAWAEHGTTKIKLGKLRYRKGRYRRSFRRINFEPEYIIVTSSGGGSAKQPCD